VKDKHGALLSALGNPKKKAAKAVVAAVQKKPQGPCDKCDGPHDETVCPHFKGRSRDTHTDALDMYEKKAKKRHNREAVAGQRKDDDAANESDDDDDDDDENLVLTSSEAKVVAQPGDGSCLFHSLSHGLRRIPGCGATKGGTVNASQLRSELEDYIASHSSEAISGTPIETWVMWDSQASVAAYTARMRTGNDWGGAIEIAVCARVCDVEVNVFERDKRKGNFIRISRFLSKSSSGSKRSANFATVRVANILYGGRCHYDAIEIV